MFGSRWISLNKPARGAKLTLDHRLHRHMLAHMHQNSNHRYWSRVLFTDEFVVSIPELFVVLLKG